MEKNEILSFVSDNANAWGMSDFQSRYFVVNSQVTNYRRVKQAMTELDVRIGQKKQIERNRKRTLINIEITKRDINSEQDDLKKQLLEVDLDQHEWDLKMHDKKLIMVDSEIDNFVKVIQDVVPDIESFQKYGEHDEIEERNYWIARMAKQASMDLFTLGRISQGNLDSIAMMPVEDQKQTIKSALKYNTILNNNVETLSLEAEKEMVSLPSGVNYIDEVVNNQLRLNHEVQSTIKPEDI